MDLLKFRNFWDTDRVLGGLLLGAASLVVIFFVIFAYFGEYTMPCSSDAADVCVSDIPYVPSVDDWLLVSFIAVIMAVVGIKLLKFRKPEPVDNSLKL